MTKLEELEEGESELKVHGNTYIFHGFGVIDGQVLLEDDGNRFSIGRGVVEDDLESGKMEVVND